MKNKEPVIYPYNGEKVSNCRSCQKPIYFFRTKNEKAMPVNYVTGQSHFIDCPGADGFKKRKPKKNNNQVEMLL